MKRLVLLVLLLVSCVPVKEPIVQQPGVQQPSIQQPSLPVLEMPEPCIDVDGVNAFVRGQTSVSGERVFDECLSLKKDGVLVPLSKVVEYTCESNRIVADIVDCEFGCESGACLAGEKPKPIVHQLISNGDCLENAVVGDVVKVAACYNNCLAETICAPAPFKSGAVSLPWQLNCLARTDKWVIEKWVEFDVLKEARIEFSAEIEGSELVLVEVRNEAGEVMAAPVRKLNSNRCFGLASGSAVSSLQPGRYVVVIGARASGTDLLRSFKGHNFAVSFPD